MNTPRTIPCTVVGTWAFSQGPVMEAIKTLSNSGTSLDAVERGINLAEQDFSFGPYHVGCGGWQNSDGFLELDAAVMDGQDLKFGAVTALQGYARAISVARCVMEKSRHNMLTGAGAASFARTQGFEYQSNLGRPPRKSGGPDCEEKEYGGGHDTLGLLVLDSSGNISAGVSTSGASGKEPGRVGDSALPGCGLYADSRAGAACCSGDGDEILKYCPSYRVVDYLKQGFSPAAACGATAREILKRRGRPTSEERFEMVIVALDKKGDTGAANVGVNTWNDDVTGKAFPGFPYVVMSEGMNKVEIRTDSPILLEDA